MERVVAMSDSDALLAAILANPDDDAPRLVYADWLDENAVDVACGKCNGIGYALPPIRGIPVKERIGPDGRIERYMEPQPPLIAMHPKCENCNGTGHVSNGLAERAEFIRVQVELARIGECAYEFTSGFAINCGCRPCVLGRRERELLNSPIVGSDGRIYYTAAYAWCGIEIRNGHEWSYGSRPPVYHRGFVHSITCTAADCFANLDEILAGSPIREVRLTTWPEYTPLVTEADPDGPWIFQGDPAKRQITANEVDGILLNNTTFEMALLAARWQGITFHLPPGVFVNEDGYREPIWHTATATLPR